MSSLNPDSNVVPDTPKFEEGLGKDEIDLHTEPQNEKDRAEAAIHLAEAKMKLGEPISQGEAQKVENLEWRALGYRPRSGSVSAEAKSYAAKQADQDRAGASESLIVVDNTPVMAETGDSVGVDAENVSLTNEVTKKNIAQTEHATKDVSKVHETSHGDNSQKKPSLKVSPLDDDCSHAAPTDKAEGHITDKASTDTKGSKNDNEENENTGPVTAAKKFLEDQFQHAKDIIRPKMINDPASINAEDASLLLSTEVKAHGTNRKASEGGIAAQAEALAKQNEAKRAAEEKHAKNTADGEITPA